jgi:NAD(P)-dependent dehydrogenase (short-subunit alcohol dehydrogenase family)
VDDLRALAGKAIVVTGAGRGLGAAYAIDAAGQGASVVINDIDAPLAEEMALSIRAGGGTAVAHEADVSQWSSAAELVQRCVDEFGAIDGLVNNAGIAAYAWPQDQDERSFRAVIEVNVLGTAFCGVHAIRRMVAQQHGSIVNIVSGAQMGMPGAGAYSASKGAIASLTYSWAKDVSGAGVRVNAISPLAHTRMETMYADFIGGEAFPESVDDAESIAPLVTYLLSDHAIAINGRVLRFNGHDINLVSPPAILRPRATDRHWTLDDLRVAIPRLLLEGPSDSDGLDR